METCIILIHQRIWVIDGLLFCPCAKLIYLTRAWQVQHCAEWSLEARNASSRKGYDRHLPREVQGTWCAVHFLWSLLCAVVVMPVPNESMTQAISNSFHSVGNKSCGKQVWICGGLWQESFADGDSWCQQVLQVHPDQARWQSWHAGASRRNCASRCSMR